MKAKFLAIVIVILMLLTVIPVFAAQPPLVTDKYYVGTIGQPRVVDPASAYDTASGELIFNVYETLITYDRESVEDFLPMLADAWWQSADRLTWTFHIRDYNSGTHKSTTVQWHDWKDRTGATHSGDYLSIDDVEYSFEREMVMDLSGGPEWMLYLPLTGAMSVWGWDLDSSGTINSTEAQNWITDINNAVTIDYATGNVTLHLDFTFPTTAFQQILAQTWGSIVHKEFCLEYGNWNGTYVGTEAYAYRRKPIKNYGPLDSKQVAALAPWLSPWPAGLPAPPVMCGTGPFIFSYWDKTTLEWKIVRNNNYWGPDGVANFTEVYVKGVPEWSTRKMRFLNGEYDSCAVPRLNMYELLQAPDPDADPLPGITCIANLSSLMEDDLFYIFNVTEGSSYLGSGSFPNGIPMDFFANTNTRKAFSYTLNWTTLLSEGWYGEAIQPASWWVKGLEPDYENYSTPLYYKDLDLAESYLKAAMYTQDGDTKSLWDWGFTLTITYNLGNDARKLANDLIVSAFNELNTKAGANRFKISNVGLDWPVILDAIMAMEMPMTQIGWLADFADADNWARPYMHSEGDWAYFQNLFADPNWNATYVDEAIDAAIRMPEGTERNMTYQALQTYYHELAPSVPTVQPLGRRWQRNWVQGYYYNVLGQGSLGNYFYNYWKEPVGTLKLVDVAAFNVEMSPTNNITTHLISQAYHSPKPGVPWLKLNYSTKATNPSNPIVNITAYVKYYNATGPDIMVLIMWIGTTTKGHSHEFGTAVTLVAAGSSVTFGPQNVSNVMPAVGDYELWIRCFVLDSYAYNVNVTKDFYASWFNATGFCDTNGDAAVNMLDYQVCKRAVGGLPSQEKWRWSCDVDCTNSVTMLDYQKVKIKIPTVYTKS